MLRIIHTVAAFLLFLLTSCAQPPSNRAHCSNTAFDEKVAKTIRFTVPTISVQELVAEQNNVRIFDTRKLEEYAISHLPKAQYLGHQDFDASRLNGVPKDAKIVLYCSIGYRSEKIGEKLQKLGYTNVYNLFGSIFEWVNQGNIVVTEKDLPTKKVHTYNQNWSKWIEDGKAEKVW